MVKQALLNWTVPGAAGGTSVIHFHDTATTNQITVALGQFVDGLESVLQEDVSVTAVQEVRQLDTATGELTAVANLSTIPTAGGTVAGDLVPDAAQALIRFPTAGIVGGQRVRGRLFVPGLPVSAIVNGQVSSVVRPDLESAGNGLLTGGYFAVWSRPKRDSGGNIIRAGSAHGSAAASVWSEWAVQRGRRVVG